MLLFLVWVPWLIWRERRRPTSLALGLPDTGALAGAPRGWRVKLAHWLRLAELAALALTVVILAQPRNEIRSERRLTDGIDLVLALDISRSMEMNDFQPNRLAVAKRVAQEFIAGRQGDRIGLVVFAGQAFTQCPLTLDYGVLHDLIEQVDFGMVGEGTAIGMAIATAANRLEDSEADSKVLILATDGVNNAGRVDPETAADLAEALGIKVYTIGVGSNRPVLRGFAVSGAQLDEAALQEIAKRTGGAYFRALDPDALRKIYERIDELETTRIETAEFVRYDEVGPLLLLPALAVLLAVVVCENSIALKVP